VRVRVRDPRKHEQMTRVEMILSSSWAPLTEKQGKSSSMEPIYGPASLFCLQFNRYVERTSKRGASPLSDMYNIFRPCANIALKAAIPIFVIRAAD